LSGKHDVFADKGPNYKKKREALHHLEKLKLLDKLDVGITIAVVRHHYGVNKSTYHHIIFIHLRYIKKNKDKTWRSIKIGAPTSEKFLVWYKWPLLKRWKEPCMYGWKVKPTKLVVLCWAQRLCDYTTTTQSLEIRKVAFLTVKTGLTSSKQMRLHNTLTSMC
jgi:hypothetical protein